MKVGVINKKQVFATPTGLKVGSKGRVQKPGEVLGTMPKGERRAFRKALRAAGFGGHAGARVAA